jgi:cell wall assembly regulator SMI1
MTTIAVILVLVVISMLGFRQLQRSIFYPQPTHLPENVHDDLATTLHRFEVALAAHAPDVLATLQPGLTDDEISAIESNYRLCLSDDVRAFYRWRNGTLPDSPHHLIAGHSFLPLDRAAQARAEIQRQSSTAPLIQRIAYSVLAGHRTNWLPMLDDFCGDGYFYDPGRRRKDGSFFYHFAENREYRFFPSLRNFLAGAAECYETGIYQIGRRSGAQEDFEKSFPLWRRYAAMPNS